MKYKIMYTTKEGDLCSIHVNANSKDDAIDKAEREYWDIDQIVSCCKI